MRTITVGGAVLSANGYLKLVAPARSLCAVLVVRGGRVLRTATNILLAIVLCLNGFLMPVAMAQHHVASEKASAVVADAPCHGDAAVPDMATGDMSGHAQHGEKAPPSKHSTPSCCTHGQCACGCLLSASAAPVMGVNVQPQREAKGRDFSHTHLTASRYTVPLRPPID